MKATRSVTTKRPGIVRWLRQRTPCRFMRWPTVSRAKALGQPGAAPISAVPLSEISLYRPSSSVSFSSFLFLLQARRATLAGPSLLNMTSSDYLLLPERPEVGKRHELHDG